MTTEQKPFVRVGGMGTIMHSLPQALNKLGHDVRVMMPRYLSIGDDQHSIKMEREHLEVPTNNKNGPETLICNVKKYDGGTDPGKPNTTYFLENQEYYEQRANVYGYADDPVRWVLLCRGTLEFLLQSAWLPDVIVCADWQTGFLSNYLKTVYQDRPRLAKIASVFSIHNLHHQGAFHHHFIQESEYDDGHSSIPPFEEPRLLKLNGMRRGIMYADFINTVSPAYAQEIMSAEYGEGLEELIAERRGALFGILNGIDYNVWNPMTDPNLEHHFSLNQLSLRQDNKTALQNYFNLPVGAEHFLLGSVGRISSQKGFDLMETALPPLLQELKIQLIFVGEGDTKYMNMIQELKKRFPGQVVAHLKFDDILPHKIWGGADAALVPSRFEPCGLTQMEAMHYGTVPIVRRTGGLADTVRNYSPADKSSNGFTFDKYDPLSLTIAVIRAYEHFQNRLTWQRLQKAAMTVDFSWKGSGQKYEALFRHAIDAKQKSQ